MFLCDLFPFLKSFWNWNSSVSDASKTLDAIVENFVKSLISFQPLKLMWAFGNADLNAELLNHILCRFRSANLCRPILIFISAYFSGNIFSKTPHDIAFFPLCVKTKSKNIVICKVFWPTYKRTVFLPVSLFKGGNWHLKSKQTCHKSNFKLYGNKVYRLKLRHNKLACTVWSEWSIDFFRRFVCCFVVIKYFGIFEIFCRPRLKIIVFRSARNCWPEISWVLRGAFLDYM